MAQFPRAWGIAASEKANRSRTVTGEERWLSPITMKGMVDESRKLLKFVGGGQQVDSPESQQDKNEGADGAPGKAAPGLGKPAVQDNQPQIEQPDQAGPGHFRVVGKARFRPFSEQERDKGQTGGEQDETGPEQARW